MRIEPFQLERWMTTYEMNVRWDIAESGIFPMSTREILQLLPPGEREGELDRLLDLRLGYSVMLAPGSAFGYEGYLRIGIGATPEVFAEGPRQTARCLRDLVAAGSPLKSGEVVAASA